MSTLPITQYIPKKYDHIARQTNIVQGSVYKHHGIIIKPDTTNIQHSHILHFWGNEKKQATIRIDTLEFFLENFKELCVYDHKDQILDELIIEENIKKFNQTPPIYDLLKNNCEDVVCQILLKENNTHKKQANGHSYYQLSKVGTSYVSAKWGIISLPDSLQGDLDTNPKIIYKFPDNSPPLLIAPVVL
jgi:hypothetical protein